MSIPSEVLENARDDLNGRATRLPGCEQFIESLWAAYNLCTMDPSNVKWASFQADRPGEKGVPVIEAAVSDKYPSLSVHLDPRHGNDIVTADTFHAPIMVSDVLRWGLVEHSLGKYEIKGKSGMPPGKEMLDEPRTLKDVIENVGNEEGIDFSKSVKDDTPVVEAVAVLPAAQGGEFDTNFIPVLNVGIHGGTYISLVFHEDRQNRWRQMNTHEHEIQIMYVDNDREMHSWSTDYVPSMSDMERLILPSSVGHMVIVAAQYEEPRKRESRGFRSRGADSFGGGFRGGEFGSSKGFDFGGDLKMYSMAAAPAPKSAEVGDMKIGKGADHGEGELFKGKLELKPKAIIYHLRVVGIKPGEAQNFTPEQLDSVAQTLSNYKAAE